MHVFSVERLKEVPSAVGSTRLLGEATLCLAAETIHGLLFPSLVFLNRSSSLFSFIMTLWKTWNMFCNVVYVLCFGSTSPILLSFLCLLKMLP